MFFILLFLIRGLCCEAFDLLNCLLVFLFYAMWFLISCDVSLVLLLSGSSYVCFLAFEVFVVFL